MCGPAEMLQSVGTGMQYGSAIAQGKAQQNMYNYQAQMDEINAKIAERQAERAVDNGANEQAKLREKYAQLRGSQRAAIGASGVAADSGSGNAVLMDTESSLAMDAETLRSNTQDEKWGHDIQAYNSRESAKMNRYAGQQARSASRLNAMSALLSGGASVANSWYQTRKSQAWP